MKNMALTKGLYGSIAGLEALANETITGVQVPNSDFGNSVIVSEEGAEFETVQDFVQMVDDNGFGSSFSGADHASITPDGRLVLGRNVGSNGVA